MTPEANLKEIRGSMVADGPDTAAVALFYPSVNPIRYLRVELADVRAADDIRISYDYDRDGWRIEQASRFEWPGDDPVCDPDWQEVAFVKAWAREAVRP
ncbi:MAG: hypothetical protein WC485_04835 [Opitutaceae bacterium]